MPQLQLQLQAAPNTPTDASKLTSLTTFFSPLSRKSSSIGRGVASIFSRQTTVTEAAGHRAQPVYSEPSEGLKGFVYNPTRREVFLHKMKTLSTDTSFKKKQTPHPQMAWTLSTAYLKKQSNFVESNARRLQVRAAAKPVKPKPEPDGEGEAERKERKLCLNELATAETNQAKSETKFLMPQVAPVEERVLRQAMREI